MLKPNPSRFVADSTPSSRPPKAHVCDRCWETLFNTEAFERCCTWYQNTANYKQTGTETTATVREIKNAACNWCGYIKNFISDDWMPEDKITTYLAPSTFPSCTPAGNNTFYLSISCHSGMGKWRGGAALFLHALTTAEDPASGYVTARPPRTDTNSEAAKMQIGAWLRECKEHKRCSALHEDSILPTRVIEVSPLGRRYARVVETKNLRGLYATLSYCWGNADFPTLTSSNYAQLTEGLDEETLPPTIRDAIATTRASSIPYLWIDALCIIQDSEMDKAKEIARMKEIYASSALTIVAAAAESVSKGFLYPRVYQEILHTIPVRLQPDIFGTMSVNELDAESICVRTRIHLYITPNGKWVQRATGLIIVYAMSLVPSIPALESANSGNYVQITKVTPSDLETLITTSVDEFQSTGCSTDLLSLLAQSAAERTQRNTVRYLAPLKGKVAASAGMAVMNGIARLYIDSVLPSAREKGLQRFLMRARLSDAVEMNRNLATSRLAVNTESC
ncbi:hypothetical protein IFM53868_05052 [Aspergillus udagawae]|uniref:Heterokaryon incompatibility domain-containing protein n=1 Tax=Aspergillus udagawae TaxID=91492 RepID=A0ABQ1ASP1_9EURO|nr:hypothetical protein IFM53868_05052 [Aspergillus udagawae]